MGDANNRLTGLIRAAEAGEEVIITRHGQPVAQLTTPPVAERPKVIFGGMKDIIKFYPGWDDPITEDQFFAGDFDRVSAGYERHSLRVGQRSAPPR